MSTINERLEAATASLEADVAKAHAIVHGPASGTGSTVVTEGGTVKTLAKIIADGEAEIAVDTAAAEAAKVAAQTAETNAETAETNAEAAQAAALAAQAAAETAAATAEGHKNAAQASADAAFINSQSAQTAKTNAETAETNAETAQAAAETARTQAQTAQSAAETARTQAQTAQAAAASSQAAASTSATNAAASAATALAVATGLSFRGQSTAALLPSSSTAGWCWLISTGGTIYGHTFATNDLAIYISANTYSRIPAADLLGIQAPARNLVEPRNGIALDGTAGIMAQSVMTNQNIGTNACSIGLIFQVRPDGVAQWLGALTGTNGVINGSAISSIVSSAGALTIRAHGATFSDQNQWSWSGFRAAYLGQAVHLVIVRNAAGNPTIYVNGVDVTANGTFTTSGSAPGWQVNVVSSFFLIGRADASSASHVGRVYSASVYNLALAAADVVEIFEMGGAVPLRFQYGSEVDVISNGSALKSGALDGPNGTLLSIGAGGGGTDETAVAGTRTGGSGAYFMRLQALGSGSLEYFTQDTGLNPLNFRGRPGQQFRFTVWARRNAGTPNLVLGGTTVTLTDSWAQYSGVGGYYSDPGWMSGWGSLPISLGNSVAGNQLDIDDLVIQRLGAILHLSFNEGSGLIVHDQTGNNLHALLTSFGLSWVQPNRAVIPSGFRTTDYVLSDGVTASRRMEWIPGTIGAVAARPISVPFEFDTVVATATNQIWGFGPSVGNASGGLEMRYFAGGDLDLVQYAPATGSIYRRMVLVGCRQAYPNQRIRGIAVFLPDSTTRPTVYINGVDVTSAFTDSNTATPPNWMPTALDTTRFGIGSTFPAGVIVPHSPIVGNLSAAEAVAWTQTGRWPTWWESGRGSAVNMLTGDNSTFAASAGSWGTLVGGTIVASGGKGVWTTQASGDGYMRIGNLLTVRGQRYFVSGTVRLVSGTPLTNIEIGSRDNAASTGGRFALQTATSVETYFSGTFTALDAPPGDFVIRSSSGNGSVYEFDNLLLIPLGPLFRPAVRSGRILPDISGNRIHGILTAGLVAVAGDYRAPVIQTALTANGELIDTAGTIPTDAIIEEVTVRNTTANTVAGFALGSASGGDQLTYRTDIPGNTTLILPIKQASAAVLTAGTYTGQEGTAFGRVYYSAISWASGSLNISVRYRRERGL